MSLPHNTLSILLPVWLTTSLNVQCQCRSCVSRNIVGGLDIPGSWFVPDIQHYMSKHTLVIYLFLGDIKIQYSPTVEIVLQHLSLLSGLLKNVIVLSLGRIYHLCFIRAFLLFNKLLYFYVQYCKCWGDKGKLQEQSTILGSKQINLV